MLLLYTDGLVERRRVALSAGIEVLASAVNSARSPEEACALAVAKLVPPEGLRDDVAIVALENAAVPSELHVTLPAEPKTLAHARRILRRWLNEQGADEGDVAEMTIAVSEASRIEVGLASGSSSPAVSARPPRCEPRRELQIGHSAPPVCVDEGGGPAPRGPAHCRAYTGVRSVAAVSAGASRTAAPAITRATSPAWCTCRMPRVLDLDQLGAAYLAGEPARRSDRHDAVGCTGDDRGWGGDLAESALERGQVADEQPLLARERAPRGGGEEHIRPAARR